MGPHGQRDHCSGQEDCLLDGPPEVTFDQIEFSDSAVIYLTSVSQRADPRWERHKAGADSVRQGVGRRQREDHGAGQGVGQALHGQEDPHQSASGIDQQAQATQLAHT